MIPDDSRRREARQDLRFRRTMAFFYGLGIGIALCIAVAFLLWSLAIILPPH